MCDKKCRSRYPKEGTGDWEEIVMQQIVNVQSIQTLILGGEERGREERLGRRGRMRGEGK